MIKRNRRRKKLRHRVGKNWRVRMLKENRKSDREGPRGEVGERERKRKTDIEKET